MTGYFFFDMFSTTEDNSYLDTILLFDLEYFITGCKSKRNKVNNNFITLYVLRMPFNFGMGGKGRGLS